jgi:hypothetical protein
VERKGANPDIESMSCLTSFKGRRENFTPLKAGQNRHWFQGQFLVTLTRRLCASLGGLITPCSYINDLHPFMPLQLILLIILLE